MCLWFSSSLECKAAIIQGVYKVMSTVTYTLQFILYYRWRTIGTWSLDIAQVNHSIFFIFEAHFYLISISSSFTQLFLLCGRFY